MKRFLLTLTVLLLSVTFGYAQGPKDMVINELLVKNATNYEDDYGHRVSWVELFNTGYSQVNLASCYLTVRSGEQTISYRIPKNDPRTLVAPQGYIIFFCEGTHSKGTFHTSFTLAMDGDKGAILDTTYQFNSEAKTVILSLLEANGKDTIDQVTYNVAEQKFDVSMGRIMNDENQYVFTFMDSTTPYATNDTSDPIPPHEEFRRTDPIGYGMAVTAMTVVFLALIALYLVFRTMGKRMVAMAQSKKEKANVAAGTVSAPKATGSSELSGEELVAITMALRAFETQQHDEESTVLTINRVAKAYSPWSAKLYGLTQLPNRK